MKKYRWILTGIFVLLYTATVYANDYKIAVRAHSGIKAAVKKWQPTTDRLNRKIPEHNFKLIPIVSLELMTRGAASGHFDFVLTNPSSYVEIKKLYGARAFVTLSNKRVNTAQNQFGSVIFTRRSHLDITKLNDIKDKSLMVVTKNAFGGWRVAWLEMLNNGIKPQKDLKKILFSSSGTQQEVVWAVHSKKVDVGVVRTDLLERMTEKGAVKLDDFRILNKKHVKGFSFYLSTALYPEWAFASLKHVPVGVTKKVKAVLRKIVKTDPAAVKGKYMGWIEPLDYSSVDKLMQRLKVGPYE